MEKLRIQGGKKISGKIRVGGAKNAVLPMMAASILTDDKVVLTDCPDIKDVAVMQEMLSSLGGKTQLNNGVLTVDASLVNGYTISSDLSERLRSSIFLVGALLGRNKKAVVSYPGGCKIGRRPIDIHINGLRKLGVTISETEEGIECVADRLVGCEIKLDFPSVGATENLMLAAVTAEGVTRLKNCAKEPEIVDLMKMLNKMGAKIYGAGRGTIEIYGVKRLKGIEYKPIGDRIECGTFLILSAICDGEIEISNVKPENILPIINKLCNNTCKIIIKNDIIYYKRGGGGSSLNVSTGPHPDFPTDLQAPITALCAVSSGKSIITENIFENRFLHIPELIKMGADITLNKRDAIVHGVKRLHGASVNAMDLRGGAALVLAGCQAEGETVISSIEHIERGYSSLVEKLSSVGVDVRKI